MSQQDYIDIENNLFADTGEEENRDYYEEEANDYTLPDPATASKNYVSIGKEDVEDADENAYESFSPISINIQRKFDTTDMSSIAIKDTAETTDMYNTRVLLYEKIQKIPGFSIEKAEVYSRVVANKLWYNLIYNDEVENVYKEILKFL
jgi:hypothetical protein